MILVIPIHCVTIETKNCLNMLTQMCSRDCRYTFCVKIFRQFFVSVVTKCIGITRTFPAFHYNRDSS